MTLKESNRWLHAMLCGLALITSLAAVGCQSSYSGQTLPSPYYTTDDVQYFPPGPEFKLSREAAVMKAYNADQQLQGR